MRPPVGDLEVVDDVPGAFAEHIEQAFAARSGPRFTLVLSGGPTARRCYERLDEACSMTWSDVDVLIGDERCVPPDHADANQEMVRRSLLDRVGPIGSFRPMSCEEGPEAYEQVLRSLPRPDVVHLGLGPDGHTASLFPGSEALDSSGDRLVAFNVDPAGDNPYRRMTLTLAGIALARLAVFTVTSEQKHDALARVCSGEDLPAARVRADRVLWLADRSATGALQ